jgi:hypothetical protein
MFWTNRRWVRRYGLLCPSCGTSLAGMDGQIDVATGICGECGSQVLYG